MRTYCHDIEKFSARIRERLSAGGVRGELSAIALQIGGMTPRPPYLQAFEQVVTQLIR
jgi:hypothetical protein